MKDTSVSRTCLSRRSLNFSRNRGFSLVELAMSLLLLALSVALALPTYWTMMEQRQAASSAAPLAHNQVDGREAGSDCTGAGHECVNLEASTELLSADFDAQAMPLDKQANANALGEGSYR